MMKNAPLVREYGMLHFHDATTIRFAEKAAAAGVDGIVCIGAGGGGHAGTISHLAFIPQVRAMFDAGCAGGCLDTLDLLSRLPNVRIAGATTATDSIFIEPTMVRLPSNYSDLSYGHKAWTSRQRPNNTAFVPAAGLVYAGNPTDEAAVRAWVGTLMQ